MLEYQQDRYELEVLLESIMQAGELISQLLPRSSTDRTSMTCKTLRQCLLTAGPENLSLKTAEYTPAKALEKFNTGCFTILDFVVIIKGDALVLLRDAIPMKAAEFQKYIGTFPGGKKYFCYSLLGHLYKI